MGVRSLARDRTKKKQVVAGTKTGRWTLQRKLGGGGNGEVWLGFDGEASHSAVKCLTKVKPGAYRRFRDEVYVLEQAAEIKGVLPIFDHYLPQTLEKRQAWYAMPVGVPIEDWAPNVSAPERVRAITEAAATMAALHAKGIAHRDLKSANLVISDKRCHIVDFGLVTYPGKENVTARGEDIGPLWTMAPEVRRFGNKANPFPADVFSLAKTLWTVLKLDHKGFEGQYITDDEAITIRHSFAALYITPLEALLASATSHDPVKRPSMRVFARDLADWLIRNDDFYETNPLEWQEALASLFPRSIPSSASWEGCDEIAYVLNTIGRTNLNHMFYPTGGGNDLQGATVSSHEPGCIELITSRAELIKPKRLTFERISSNCEWCYFRLEAEELEACGIYGKDYPPTLGYESVTEISGGKYAEASCWDNDEYENAPLPSGARWVDRWSSGAFVIFQKSSFYNLASGRLDAYDGRHNNITR
jgi:serine/threonine-protein kinase